MATLILTLPQTPLQVSTPIDYVLSPDGLSVGTASSAPLSMLPGVGGAVGKSSITETVLLLGAAQLSWHRVSLPKGVANARLRAALEGLLEDQLLDDPASLHFALEPGGERSACAWVAVCDKTWLRNGLQALDAAGIVVARIVPELLPVSNENATTDTLAQGAGALVAVQGAGGQPLLLHANSSGVLAWPLQAQTVAWLNWPTQAPVRAEPAVSALSEQLFERPVLLQTRAERALVACQSDWDLAQFDLVNTQRSRSLKRLGALWRTLLQAPRWRAARWSVMALVAVNLVGLNVRAAAERAALMAQTQAIATVLTSTFPATQVVVDAPVQMQRAVAALRQGSGELGSRDFETLLGAWAQAAPMAGAPSGLDFTNGQLRLQGLGLEPAALAEATLALRAQGLTLRPEGADLLLRSSP